MTSASRQSPPAHRVLVADDEPNVRRIIRAYLDKAGLDVQEAGNAREACQLFSQASFDVVVTDLKMPDSDEDGLEVLRYVTRVSGERGARVPVIVLTAYGTADRAIELLEKGAYNLISKPCDMAELVAQVLNAIRERQEAAEQAVRDEAQESRFGLIGKTQVMSRIFDTIQTVADTPSTVLISGESGTGKELIARALHHYSARKDRPFIRVNCAAIPESLLESELFGHEKGAFTGAVASRPGRFEQADTGTLFLDEIGEMRPDLQVKLLRALQEQEFERVGGVRTVRVDVRIVAATNRDLMAEVKAGGFREDLFYRLNVVPIALPPLRDRRDDIPFLIDHFLKKYNRKLSRAVQSIDRTLQEALGRYHWPGNIRELENVVERMLLFSGSSQLGVRDLPQEILAAIRGQESRGAPATNEEPAAAPPPPPPVASSVTGEGAAARPPVSAQSMRERIREETSRLERDMIIQALNDNSWNVTRTAEWLGYSRKGLQLKMKELDIRKPGG